MHPDRHEKTSQIVFINVISSFNFIFDLLSQFIFCTCIYLAFCFCNPCKIILFLSFLQVFFQFSVNALFLLIKQKNLCFTFIHQKTEAKMPPFSFIAPGGADFSRIYILLSVLLTLDANQFTILEIIDLHRTLHFT